MVVFTCGHCGESVAKPKVEKHYMTKCRNKNPNLSCMDCFKDFLGNAYESHTKCITEEERYSAKGFQAKEKKGEKKQSTWVEMLQAVLEEQPNAPRNVLRIIETVSKHNNTPRKRPKFFNFVKNVCGSKTSPKDIDQAWELISVKLSALSLANQNKNQNKKGENADDNDKQEESENDEGKDSVASGTSGKDATGSQNGSVVIENQAAKEENLIEENKEEDPNKKLSKKQRKEEKKRKKYEAELQSAEAPPAEEEEMEEQPTKKGKKKKTKSECSNGEVEENQQEGKNKNKKRKRQDTANSVPETQDNGTEEPALVARVTKKKVKVDEDEELEDSVCLHDQNVAKIGELNMNSDKFNWHAVIRSVLEKKDGELPFKRLQKKVLMEYCEATGMDVDDRIADKFIKKLKSAPNVRVDKNRVLLLD